MRRDARSARGLVALLPVAILASCGSGDRVAGGTIGTETGNAVTARLVFPDGAPAVGARVVVRPSDAIDSSCISRWLVGATDSSGLVSLDLPLGSWVLEATSGSRGLSRSVDLRASGSRTDTLRPLDSIRGVVLAARPGATVFLPGLARRTRLDSNGVFSFAAIPPGDARLALDGGATWPIPDTLRKTLVVASGVPGWTISGLPFAVEPTLVPRSWRVAGSAIPSGVAALVDRDGAAVPFAAGPLRGGFRQVWSGPAPTGAVALVRSDELKSASPFLRVSGLRAAWVPELAWSDSGLVLDSTARLDSTVEEGRFRIVELGMRLGELRPGILPDSGDFAVSLRAAQTIRSVGSLWLFDWTDSSGTAGIRVGIGSGRLVVRSGGLDTAVAWPDRPEPVTWKIHLSGSTLVVAADGVEVFRGYAPSVKRIGWAPPAIARGGGLAVAWLLAAE